MFFKVIIKRLKLNRIVKITTKLDICLITFLFDKMVLDSCI